LPILELQLNVKEKIISRQNISKSHYDKMFKPLLKLMLHQNVLIRNGNTWERSKVIHKDKTLRNDLLSEIVKELNL